MPTKRQQTSSVVPSKRPRQEPVSCSFCRNKKLKCNRQSPCSNCASRSLTCDNEPQTRTIVDGASVEAADDSILARLKRLEDVVLGQTGLKTKGISVASTSTLDPLNIANSDPWLTPASEYEETVHNLEKVVPRDSPRIFSTTCQTPVKYSISESSVEATSQRMLSPKSFFLPSKEQALLLLDHYKSCIGDLQHVVYVPRVRTITESLYHNLEHNLHVAHSHVALVLSVFASTVALCSSSNSDSMGAILKDVNGTMAVGIWSHAALEILEYSRCTTSGSLEDVQASILLGFLLYHIEGFSARPRTLLASAIAVARDMSLHKVDVTSPEATIHESQSVRIEKEIKRRVWWYLTSSDWLMALNGGPQEGTYLVSPQQMRVDWPLNINDDDLACSGSPTGLPLSEYTTMSYFIQRIRLAEIYRSAVDVLPLSNTDIALVDYEDILKLDERFKKFILEVPGFLRTDEKSRHESAAIAEQHPHVKAQGVALRMMAHVGRCKLHQPFLVGRSAADQYLYSRQVSLESARTVIQTNATADQESGASLASIVKSTWLIHHVFLATIVLLMDLCFNKMEGDDTARKVEVSEACRLLEKAGTHSGVAGEYLSSLMDVLRKHNLKLHVQENELLQTRTSALEEASCDSAVDPAQENLPVVSEIPSQVESQVQFSDIDEIWKDFFEFGPNMDMPEWDRLFFDLDSKQ